MEDVAFARQLPLRGRQRQEAITPPLCKRGEEKDERGEGKKPAFLGKGKKGRLRDCTQNQKKKERVYG